MKEILLISQSFPYLPGEQFLETEVKYFAKDDNLHLTILPLHGGDEKRVVNPLIRVDDYLTQFSINKEERTPLDYVKFIFNRYFYKELTFYNLFNIVKLKSFIGSINKHQKYYKAFDTYFMSKKNMTNHVVYTYWNNEITYALESLKPKYGYKLISRIHGFDLYKEVRPSNYMPLKKQFCHRIDKIYTITSSANNYLNEIYGIDNNKIELSRLGVNDQNIISIPNKKNILHIVSCSSLTEIKRIDKIIDTLYKLSVVFSDIHYYWTHIGDGSLYDDLKNKANDLLDVLPNIDFEFKGHLDNQDVYRFYKNNKVDLFINVSKSEGVPVSIMEAMSCHIPILAPDIGGISDMIIVGGNGFLLNDKCEIEEIVNALRDIEFYKNKEVRERSYKIFLEKYHAKNNYSMFLNSLANI